VIAPPGFSFRFSARTHRHAVRWAAVAILLLAAGLRLAALGRDARFHPDEALFATFARNAAVQGDWLLHGNLDKPPLAIYASAMGMALFGVQPLPDGVLNLDVAVGEFAARLPAALAGVVWVAVVMALARRLYRRDVFALWAGLFAACSPMAILFSASAFTDGWMLLWMTAALWALAAGRWGWSGVALALAFATKPQGLVYLPLVIGLGWALRTLAWRGLTRLLVPLAVGIGMVALWDGLRAGSPSLFALAAANNAPSGLVPPAEWAARAGDWLAYGRGLFGPISAFFGLLIIVFLGRSLVRRPRTPGMNADLVLAVFVLVYALAHLVIGLNVYDRYWLPLLPPLLLLAVRAGVWAYAALSRLIMRAELQAVAVILALAVLAFGADAAGGNPGYSGGVGDSFARQPAVDEAAAWLSGQPVATVIYDRWLGWQLGYYLGAWSDKRLTYFPAPDALVTAALALDETGPRYLPIPLSANAAPWIDALTAAGFGVDEAEAIRGITIWRITPPD
jgi:4-amino-4-deoxy-L-arabinose transferase-like glycosyltransferase